MDPRDLDVEEVRTVKNFHDATCKCSKRKGGPCSAYFSVEELGCKWLNWKVILLMIILSQINAHHFAEGLQGHRSTASANTRVKDYTLFHCHGHPICLSTFLFYHGIGKNIW